MSEPVAVEAETGARLLPHPAGPMARHLNSYIAASALSADLRATSTPHREAAERIIIVRARQEGGDRG